jgi:hypothetical protein
LSRDKEIFFEKKKIKLFDTANSRIYVLESMGAFVLRENFIFEKKKFLEKNILKKILKKILKIFFERKIHRVESGRAYTHVHRG